MAICLSSLVWVAGCGSEQGIQTYTIPTKIPEELVPGNDRMLAVMIPRGEKVWFFKLSGPEKAIDSVADAFRGFVTDVVFDEAGEPNLKELPDGWIRGGKKPMRFATVNINTPGKQLDLSISNLPTFGTWDEYVKQNVDRWRGQLNLATSEEKWSGGESIEIASAEGQAVWVDFVGKPAASSSMGRPPFLSQAAPGGSPGPPRAAGSENNPSASGSSNDSPKSRLKFDRPEGWRDGKGSSMRLAAFFVGPEDLQAEVTVIPAGGDLRGNVARWMGQVQGGQPEDAEVDTMLEQAEKLSVSGRDAQRFVIMGGEEEGQNSIDATIIPMDGGFSMFVKMTGPAKTVADQGEAMRTFLESLSF